MRTSRLQKGDSYTGLRFILMRPIVCTKCDDMVHMVEGSPLLAGEIPLKPHQRLRVWKERLSEAMLDDPSLRMSIQLNLMMWVVAKEDMKTLAAYRNLYLA